MKRLLLCIFWLVFFFSGALFIGSNQVHALNAIVRPDGDVVKAWRSTGAANYTEIDEVVTQPTAGDTADYVDNNVSPALIDRYSMGSISNIQSATAVSIWAYAYCDKNNSSITTQVFAGGVSQGSSTVGIATSYGWTSTSFTGLTLNQSQLDSLEVSLTVNQGQRTCFIATLYADVTYTEAPAIAISLNTDGVVNFGNQALNTTQDTSATGINDIEVISVDAGPANLSVKSSGFSDGSNPWSLGTGNGANQVLWEFSKDNSIWTTFALANNDYTFDTNVPASATRNLFLRLTMPTTTNSYSAHSSTITITASAP